MSDTCPDFSARIEDTEHPGLSGIHLWVATTFKGVWASDVPGGSIFSNMAPDTPYVKLTRNILA